MDKYRIKELLKRYHAGLLTSIEQHEFSSLLDDPKYSLLMEESMDEFWPSKDELKNNPDSPNSILILENLLAEKRRKFKAIILIRSLAAVVALTFLTIFLFNANSPPTRGGSSSVGIPPGGNKAQLIFADGSKIVLSSSVEGIKMGTEITYIDGKSINSHLSDKLAGDVTLEVPLGGTYSVILEDGTRVWLNSNSRLVYPARFNESKRKVVLEGEAYFKVTKVYRRNQSQSEKVPFEVSTQGQIVQVLGTEFNVSAYSTDKSVSTTLVEGKVKVVPTMTKVKNQFVLKPGESSTVTSEYVRLAQANVKKATAWKEGFFDFTDMELHDVMNALGRWYNLEIIYEGDIPKISFYGTIERNNQLSTVMTLLETNDLGYRLSGRKLTVFYIKPKEGVKGK